MSVRKKIVNKFGGGLMIKDDSGLYRYDFPLQREFKKQLITSDYIRIRARLKQKGFNFSHQYIYRVATGKRQQSDIMFAIIEQAIENVSNGYTKEAFSMEQMDIIQSNEIILFK